MESSLFSKCGMTGACMQFTSYKVSLVQNPCQALKNIPSTSECSRVEFEKLASKRLQFYKRGPFSLIWNELHGRDVNMWMLFTYLI